MSKKVPDNDRYQMVVEWTSKKGKKKRKVFKDSETRQAVLEFMLRKKGSMTREDKFPDSSFPENPPLKGKTWNKEKLDAVRGRVVEIGWLDTLPMRVFVISADMENTGWGYVEYYNPLNGEFGEIDSPNQVRKIGSKILGALNQTGFFDGQNWEEENV